MGKKAERSTLIHQSEGMAVEQTSIYDDSLLPAADELAKLKELDPECINWIKRRTEIEQDARIQFNRDRIRLMSKDMNQVTTQNIICILAAFIIIMSGFACSAFFVYRGLNIEGTVFGGGSLVFAALIFMRWRSNSKPFKK